MKIIRSVLFLHLILLTVPNSLTAQEHNFLQAPHHLSVLIADTHIDGEGHNETLGLDYEYRVSELLGLGVVAEHAFGELDATSLLAVADIHIHEGWIIQVGPGYEWEDTENVFIARMGLLYEFEWDGFTVSPQLHWDYHVGKHNAVVAGLAFGFGF